MINLKRNFAGLVTATIGLTLAACGGMPQNATIYSTKQPVVERTNYTFDVQTGADGLSIPEQQRLAGWFEAMDLRYGDRVSIEDPMVSAGTRDAIEALAQRYGILVSEQAPVTTGYVEPGYARIVITRSKATVPGCPDWSAKSEMNYNNATNPGYGCAINSNLAAMIADPEDLISGDQGSGETFVRRSSQAVEAYREKAPEGAAGALPGGAATGGSGGN